MVSQYYLCILTCVISLSNAYSQATVHDVLGAPHYELMSSELIDLGVVAGKATLGMFPVAETLDWELNSITQMHTEIITLGESVIEFIDNECVDYVTTQYPLLDAEIFGGYRSVMHLGNKKKQDLFLNKFELEKQNIENYINVENPISEGERILLMLSAIEDIMITCLEQEDEF